MTSYISIDWGGTNLKGIVCANGEVSEVFDGTSIQLINTAYGAETKSKIFDISTFKDEEKVQPNGKVNIKVPMPEEFTTGNVFAVYVDTEKGTVTQIPVKIVDGYVVFQVEHFSYYAIVEKPASVKFVSIGDIELKYKKSAKITPNINADEGANYTVSYSSSNEKVATVDQNGKVYGAKRGDAKITCTVMDENGNTVSDTCNVKVKYSFGQWLIKILLFGWIWY